LRILVVNVNTTATMTEGIRQSAIAASGPDTEIVALTPAIGSPSVECNFESYLSAVAVMDAVVTYPEPFDAVIQAGFGEHGKEGLQELLSQPAVDIAEAAAQLAMSLGARYSVVTTLRRAVPMLEDRLRGAGLFERCVSVRAAGMNVLDLEEDPKAAIAAIVEEARRAVDEDGAEVIVLGCGGMAGLAEAIEDALKVPVVDPVAAGVVMAESLVRLGLRTSKVNSLATPPAKDLVGWPLRAPVRAPAV
jgi:allantoin racemase